MRQGREKAQGFESDDQDGGEGDEEEKKAYQTQIRASLIF